MREQEFYESVRDRILESLPDGFEDAAVDLTTQVKHNDVERTGITIRRPEELVCPIIYLDDYFKAYEDGKSLDEVASQIIDVRVNIDDSIAQNIDPRAFADYDAIRPRLQMRAYDTEKNELKLAGLVHHCFGDFSAAYSILVGDQTDRNMCVMVTPTMMEMWGISKKRLHDDTILADLSRGPVLSDMTSVMSSMGIDSSCRNYFEDLQPLDMDSMAMPLFVLTNASSVNGAGLILNSAVQQKIADLVQGDYYVLPSSVHEVLILPDDGSCSVRELAEMVHEINRSVVAPEDILSDKVQFYDAKSRTLVNAQEHEMAKERTPAVAKAKSI